MKLSLRAARGPVSQTLSLFILMGQSAIPLKEQSVPSRFFLSIGILNSNETPNRSIKAGARGSNPTSIGVKFVFYLCFFRLAFQCPLL